MVSLFSSIWNVFQYASLYLLVGYGLATVLHIYLDPQKLVTILGRNRFGAILRATLYGIPLPLCSCAVIPSAIALKKKGVRNSAIIAYLIATPESGLDSMAITYGLMGWTFTIFRVVSAFLIAITTGSVIELVEVYQAKVAEKSEDSCCCGNSSCNCRASQGEENYIKSLTWIKTFIANFNDLFDETAGWLLTGLVLSGCIDFLIPVGFFQQEYFAGFYSYLIMLLIGLPMYICASASTPIAAMLVYKGLSPGAALVFLLMGPATNLGSVLLLIRTFGRKTIYYYLIILSILAILAGFIVDNLQSLFPVKLSANLIKLETAEQSVLATVCAVFFVVLVVNSLYRAHKK